MSRAITEEIYEEFKSGGKRAARRNGELLRHAIWPDIIQQTFDLPVMVQPHPCYNCPLIIAMPFFVAETEAQIQTEANQQAIREAQAS